MTWMDTGRKLEAREHYLVSCDSILKEVFTASIEECEGFRKWFIDFWEEFDEDSHHAFMLHEHQLYTVSRYLGIDHRVAEAKFDIFSEIDRRRLLGFS